MPTAVFRIIIISNFFLVTIMLPAAGRASPAVQVPSPTNTRPPRATKTPSPLPSNTQMPAASTPTPSAAPTGTPTESRQTVQPTTETRVATSTESRTGADGEVTTQPTDEPTTDGGDSWQDLISISPLWLFCLACCAPPLLGFAGWSVLRNRGIVAPDDSMPSSGAPPIRADLANVQDTAEEILEQTDEIDPKLGTPPTDTDG